MFENTTRLFNFTILKKLYIILFIIFGLQIGTFAQAKVPNPASVETTVKLVKFYPNPANSVINFDFQKGYKSNYTIQIFNLLGKKILEIKNLSPRTSINLESFYRGMYIFKLNNANGDIVESGKFQIVK